MVRCFLARRKLKRLRLAEWTKRALHLAKALKRFWCARQLWRRKKRERAVYRARMLKKKANAALNIQRCFRGLLGRRLARLRANLQSEVFRRRHLAAVKIQACTRRRMAGRRVVQLRRLRRARWKVGWNAILYGRRRKLRRTRACVEIQRVTRGFLSRLLARRLRAEKLRREREEAEQRRLEAQRLALLAAAEEAATRRIELRITVNGAILRRMGVLGPAEAILWCVRHNILCFCNETSSTGDRGGYGLGPVPLQVVSTVESVFPSLISRRPKTRERPAAIPSEVSDDAKHSVSNQAVMPHSENIVDVDADSKCIKLRRWDDEFSSDQTGGKNVQRVPCGSAELPMEWKQAVKVGTGAEVVVNRGTWSVDLQVKILADAFYNPVAAMEPGAIRWTVVTIVLEADQIATAGKNVVAAADLWADQNLATAGIEELDAPEFKFKFKDTVVLLQPPARTPTPPPISPVLTESSSSALSVPSSPLPALRSPIDDSFSDVGSPPQQAHRITVMLEPNWDAFARTIQRRAKLWVRLRFLACRKIQVAVLRWRRLRRWRWAVVAMLARAHYSVRRIQTVVRRMLGAAKVAMVRGQVCARLKSSAQRFARRVVDDLSHCKFASEDELACWAAFGINETDAIGIIANNPYPSASLSLQLNPADARFVTSRSQLLNEAMSFVKLPPAPWGIVAPQTQLLASSISVSHKQDGQLGTVFAVPPSSQVPRKSAETQPDTIDVSLDNYGIPNLFVKLSERMVI